MKTDRDFPEQQRVKLDKEKLEDVIGGVEARCRVSAGRKGENTAEGKIGPPGHEIVVRRMLVLQRQVVTNAQEAGSYERKV